MQCFISVRPWPCACVALSLSYEAHSNVSCKSVSEMLMSRDHVFLQTDNYETIESMEPETFNCTLDFHFNVGNKANPSTRKELER